MKVSNAYFLLCLSSLRFRWDFLSVALLYVVGVFAYDFRDVVIVYHPVGRDGFCVIFDFLQDSLAEFSKESGVMTSFWRYNWKIGDQNTHQNTK